MRCSEVLRHARLRGCSDTRKNLRRFFEVDAECIVVATLYELSRRGALAPEDVARAIKDLGVNPEKSHPICV